MNNINLAIKEWTKDIDFVEETHVYTSKSKPEIKFTSGTTVISEFHDHFDAEKIANKLAGNDEIKKAQLKCQWACSSPKGTYIHRLAELYCMDLMGDYEFPINFPDNQFQALKQYIDSFIASGWKILQPELIIYDYGYKISGMADLILYNDKNQIMIVDFKTCKSIPKHSFNGKTMKEPISNLEDTKFNHYALQLSLYQHILEKNFPGIQIVGRVLVQSSEEGTKALIPVPYLAFEITQILEYRNNRK